MALPPAAEHVSRMVRENLCKNTKQFKNKKITERLHLKSPRLFDKFDLHVAGDSVV